MLNKKINIYAIGRLWSCIDIIMISRCELNTKVNQSHFWDNLLVGNTDGVWNIRHLCREDDTRFNV